MSKLTVRGNSSGTGTVIVESPDTNVNRTISLPDATTTLVGTDAPQTLTNKTIQGGALTQMTAQASTSGTVVDFTGIPAWAKRITVTFSGVSTSGADPVIIQIGAGAVDATGYLGSGSSVSSGGAIAELRTTGFQIGGSGQTSSFVRHGAITLTVHSGNIWVANGAVGQSDAAQIMACAGAKSLSGALDRVRVTTVGGVHTFDAGTINITYEG